MGEALRTACQFSPHFPFNTIRVAARSDRGANAWTLRGVSFGGISRDLGTRRRTSARRTALRRILNEARIDPALIEGDEIKNRLRANVDEAVSRGAFGAPTFFVNGEMFWGNDRLDFVEEALMRMA